MSRRGHLVETAMRAFARGGFHATGIDQVLREAGVSRVTLYNHFRSKDELIVAALRRRDETFRNQIHRSIDARARDPIGRILAAFDFAGEWFASDEFNGCMFLNATAEFPDPDCAVRRAAGEHHRMIAAIFLEQCREAGLKDPSHVARQLHMLFAGAVARAHALDCVQQGPDSFRATAESARDAASLVIDAARRTSP